MANKQSALKEIRKSKTNQIRNRKITDTFKNLAKKAVKAIEAKDKTADDLVAKTMKELDKAAAKGIIKKNTKDRKKSRLHKKLNASK